MRSAGPPDDSVKVTLGHLRGADRICPRRLAREHADIPGNSGSNLRWRIANRVADDIRLAHTDLAPPRIDRFGTTADLTPEQARVYELATRWYVTLFGDRAVRAVDEDQWATDRPDGIRLVGQAGLGLTDAEGQAEVRLLQVSGWPEPAEELAESAAVRFALLRRPGWLDGRTVRITRANLVRGTFAETAVDTDALAPVLDDWLADRMTVIRARVADGTPELGLQCGRCAFIAGCPALR